MGIAIAEAVNCALSSLVSALARAETRLNGANKCLHKWSSLSPLSLNCDHLVRSRLIDEHGELRWPACR